MNDRMQSLVMQIKQLEAELLQEMQKKQREFLYEIRKKRVLFQQEVAQLEAARGQRTGVAGLGGQGDGVREGRLGRRQVLAQQGQLAGAQSGLQPAAGTALGALVVERDPDTGDPRWVELPESEYFQLQPFGRRTRMHRYLIAWKAKPSAQPNRR